MCHEDGVDTRYIYCQDANFNVVALTADAGVIVEKTWYEAYGQPTWYYSSSEQTSSSVANPLLFQGRRWASEATLYYFRNRDMSPVLGRFVQRDPIGYVDGMSLYTFVGSVPVVAKDAYGLQSVSLSYKDNKELLDGGKADPVVFISLGSAAVARVGTHTDVKGPTWDWGRFETRYDYCAGSSIRINVKVSGAKKRYTICVRALAILYARVQCPLGAPGAQVRAQAKAGRIQGGGKSITADHMVPRGFFGLYYDYFELSVPANVEVPILQIGTTSYVNYDKGKKHQPTRAEASTNLAVYVEVKEGDKE